MNDHIDWSKPLVEAGILKTPALIKSFSKVHREDFLPNSAKHLADIDTPLSIGHDQTNSQPLLVAEMLEILAPQRNQKILDVGAGSGWTTALLAEVVGTRGMVIGTEIVPELVEFGRNNLAKYKFPQAIIRQAGSAIGASDQAPFDRILVSANISDVDLTELIEQLSPNGGRLVAPVSAGESDIRYSHYNQKVILVTKNGKAIKTEDAIPNVVFVPIVHST